MDYYADTAPDRSAHLQLQAWHISSSPSWRNGFLPRLSSIPEACEENRVAHAAAGNVQQHHACSSQRGDCNAFAQQTGFMLVQKQLQQQCASMTGSTADAACCYSKQQKRQRNPQGGDDTSSSSSSEDRSADAVDNSSDVPAVAASTWATSIRHFTDCVPITPESMCSTNTYLGTPAGQQRSGSSGSGADQQLHAPFQQQQDKEQQVSRGQQQAVAVPRSGSLPNSNSCGSLPPGGDDSAAAANEAAVQASLLAALQELDDLEWCPWDRVTKWLENHTAVAAAGAAAVESPTDGDQQLNARGSTSIGTFNIAAANASSTAQQQLNCVVDSFSGSAVCDTAVLQAELCEPAPAAVLQAPEAVFDAPAWWQEAVLARLQQQREAFQGSWWSRARVLASLAAVKAACALQI